MSDTWTLVSGYTASNYSDDIVWEVDPATKKLAQISGQALVAGEENSQYIVFQMDRYWDGIDISGKTIQVIYELEGTYFGTSNAVSAEVTDDSLRFGWIVPETACCVTGTLLFVIVVTDTDYVLKTQIATTSVYSTISEDDVVPEPTNAAWYEDFQTRVDAALDNAENALSQAQTVLAQAQTYVGAPLVASTAAEMTDTSRVYVYVGSEDGYTSGNWYYYNGSAWTSGGVYNAVAVNTDTTLTQSGVPADAKAVGDEFSSLNAELNAVTLDDWIDGYYYNGASSVTNIKPTDTKTSATGYSCMVVDCFADDVFYLTGKGGSGAKLWLWTKNNGDVISRAVSNATADNLRLVPPNDAQYLYIAIQSEQPHSLTKVTSVDERIADTIGDLLGAEKVESWVRYKYIMTNGTTVDVNSLVDGYANSYVILSCVEGDTFVVTGTGGSGARLYCFTDSSYNVLAKAPSSYVTANEVITAPADTAYLIVNVAHYRYYALYKLRSNSFGTLLNDRVAVLENAVDALPDYLEDEAQDTVDKIKNACTEGAYVIGFVTDSHYGISNSAFTTNWDTTAKTLKRVNELRRFDLLIHGGDMADGNVAKADTSAILSRFVSDLRGINPDAMMLSGNHDDNLTYYKANGTGFISRAERRAIYANGCEGERLSNYSAWYKDVPWLGLRVIGLDYLMDDSTYADHSYWGFTTEQIEWVRDTALNTSNQVVFFSHGPCTTEYGYGRDGVPTTVQNGDTLRGVIETFISNGGTVVGFFHGHTHWDFIGQYSQVNGFREVSTGRSVMDTWTSANITYSPQGAVFVEKTADTVTQELWDAIVIKPQSRSVSIIRYGAGSDRTFTY